MHKKNLTNDLLQQNLTYWAETTNVFFSFKKSMNKTSGQIRRNSSYSMETWEQSYYSCQNQPTNFITLQPIIVGPMPTTVDCCILINYNFLSFTMYQCPFDVNQLHLIFDRPVIKDNQIYMYWKGSDKWTTALGMPSVLNTASRFITD